MFDQLMNNCPFQAGSAMHADIQTLFFLYVSCFAVGNNDLSHGNINGLTRLTNYTECTFMRTVDPFLTATPEENRFAKRPYPK